VIDHDQPYPVTTDAEKLQRLRALIPAPTPDTDEPDEYAGETARRCTVVDLTRAALGRVWCILSDVPYVYQATRLTYWLPYRPPQKLSD
jgi:hypothetical protein